MKDIEENMKEPQNYLQNVFINDYTELKCNFKNEDKVLAENSHHWLVCSIFLQKGIEGLSDSHVEM